MKSKNKKYIEIFISALIILCTNILDKSFYYAQMYEIQKDTITINHKISPLIIKLSVDDSDYPIIINVDVIDKINSNSMQLIADSLDTRFEGISFIDINLDNYIDIDLQSAQGLNEYNSFWLYDTTENRFKYSEEYSVLTNYNLDPIKKEISSHAQPLGGRGYYECLYGIENNHLVMYSESQFDWFESYFNKRINNKFVTVHEIIQVKCESINGKDVRTLEEYELIYDSLLITNRYWMVDSDMKLSEETFDNPEYNCLLVNICSKYLQKESFYYTKDRNDKIIMNKKKYEMRNGKWNMVKELSSLRSRIK